jgi:hypothetical protein
MNGQIGNRAGVVGGSMAGLLAARMLADNYGQVRLVDRDDLPEASTYRRGVPHARHIRARGARWQPVLEELFPGFTAELVADGAPGRGHPDRRLLPPQRPPAPEGVHRARRRIPLRDHELARFRPCSSVGQGFAYRNILTEATKTPRLPE